MKLHVWFETFTFLICRCSATDFERFKTGELPACAPSSGYMDTLVNGLVEGKQLSKEEAIRYVNDAVIRAL